MQNLLGWSFVYKVSSSVSIHSGRIMPSSFFKPLICTCLPEKNTHITYWKDRCRYILFYLFEMYHWYSCLSKRCRDPDKNRILILHEVYCPHSVLQTKMHFHPRASNVGHIFFHSQIFLMSRTDHLGQTLDKNHVWHHSTKISLQILMSDTILQK